MRKFLIAAVFALGAAVSPALAGETFPGAAALDTVEASFVRHTREHRMMEIERNMDRQQRRDYRHGYGRGPGYGHHRGYDRGPRYRGPGYGRPHGPPPHARGYYNRGW